MIYYTSPTLDTVRLSVFLWVSLRFNPCLQHAEPTEFSCWPTVVPEQHGLREESFPK